MEPDLQSAHRHGACAPPPCPILTAGRIVTALDRQEQRGESHDRQANGRRRHLPDVGQDYFEKRGLRRYARVWSLWALGVGAVISGHYSGWNFGLGVGGFGAMFIALFIIAAMYLGLIFSLAEMSPALPHTGAAYSFARSAMGPWGGIVTGLAESIEYILTPAVIVFFIGSYLSEHLRDAGRSTSRCGGSAATWCSSRSTTGAWSCRSRSPSS